MSDSPVTETKRPSPLDRVIRFCLEKKLVVALIVLFVFGWGVLVAPFGWDVYGLPRDPVAVDAIPDIGENQQIVFTRWMGRSPQDMEDQITYPLAQSLAGIPGTKTIRTQSMFGFSMIYIIFDESIDFYWSRSRILEKLNSLPSDTLPDGVQPALGPDATALGQIYWYTLEGRDADGEPIGGWDLHELRSIQDWNVRYALQAARGISEVASVGGFVQEYQIDVDPDAMRAADVTLTEIFNAVRMSNVDVGARTVEINRAEYVIRGLGFIKQVSDIEVTVIKVNENVPIHVRDVANVSLGPALRRGALDKEGAEAVGGVAVVRYGFNPLEAIENIKTRIDEIAAGLGTRAIIDGSQVSRGKVREFAETREFEAYAADGATNHDAWLKWLRATPREKWPDWVNTSQVTVVPFYDRSGLIHETLGTLDTALSEEILVTIIVVLFTVMHLRSSFLISILLPLAVLMCFIAMKTFHVDANIVALSGIAIAIGTMVDMGIVLCENILKHLDEADPEEDKLEVIYRASSEVGSAVLTAVATTIVSFLPVFTMSGAEGKLFRPLAFTKTFALASSVIVALTIIPPAAHVLFGGRIGSKRLKRALMAALVLAGVVLGVTVAWWAGAILAAMGVYQLCVEFLPSRLQKVGPWIANSVAIVLVGVVLTDHWLPLGPELGMARNLLFVGGLLGSLLLFFQFFQRVVYVPLLRWCLANKLLFLSVPMLVIAAGLTIWLGPGRLLGRIPQEYSEQSFSSSEIAKLSGLNQFKYGMAGLEQQEWKGDVEHAPFSTKIQWTIARQWDGLSKEFMPTLDEGSYLYMPTTMPHASIGEALEVMQIQDKALRAIPEVDQVVGKLGRAETPLDPAPVSMFETIINYKPEYITDAEGRRETFRFDDEHGEFARDQNGELIPDDDGRPFRQWRDHIRKPRDIWDEILAAAEVPGTTSAPELQPIAARIAMLQSGMRAPMGIKIKGPDLETIEAFGMQLERLLKQVPGVAPKTVNADRIVGKPYLEIDIDREAIARYGLHIRAVQDVIEVAVGGRQVTRTVEGRERYPVRIRYMRELRDSIETLGHILVPAPDGAQIPLTELAEIRYVRGPQVIKSEDTFLVGYVTFDKQKGHAEVDVVERCQAFLDEKIASGELVRPAGVTPSFTGNYENQLRSEKRLMLVLPIALFVIFLILYFQFNSVITTSLVFSGILVAWAGGFIMIWCYGQPWFLDFDLFGTSMQTLFQVHPIKLSVAIWVGFLALFGIASDDGVVISTYLDQSFAKAKIDTIEAARESTVLAGARRVRPCLMTTATTILALIPVLTSTGRGSDIMVPMAIPSFGGMAIEIMTMLVVPVLYCAVKEWKLRLNIGDALFAERAGRKVAGS